MRTYEKILKDVAISCSNVFNHGYCDHYLDAIQPDIIKAATDIYIAELRERSFDDWSMEARSNG